MRSELDIRPEDFDRSSAWRSHKSLINFAIMLAGREGREETSFFHCI